VKLGRIQSAGWRSGGSESGTESARVDDEEVAVSFAVGGVESALEWTGEVSPGERAAKDWSSIIFAIIAIRTIEQSARLDDYIGRRSRCRTKSPCDSMYWSTAAMSSARSRRLCPPSRLTSHRTVRVAEGI
jgi:hypothetical protein